MPAGDLYDPAAADAYEARAAAAFPGRDGLFRIVGASLADLRPGARVLVVGCGAGREILELGGLLPGATFVGVDPSGAMLEHCRRRVVDAGLEDRVELKLVAFPHASVGSGFDAATALFVSQHLPRREQVVGFFAAIVERFLPKGRVLTADMFLPDGQDRASTIDLWARQARTAGLDDAFIAAARAAFGKAVRLRRAAELRRLQRRAGISAPQLLFSSLLYGLWGSSPARPLEGHP